MRKAAATISTTLAALLLATAAESTPPRAMTMREVQRAASAYGARDVSNGFAAGYSVQDCHLTHRGRRGSCQLFESDATLPGYPTGTLQTGILVTPVNHGQRVRVTDSLASDPLTLPR